jgi:hypothetical protein
MNIGFYYILQFGPFRWIIPIGVLLEHSYKKIFLIINKGHFKELKAVLECHSDPTTPLITPNKTDICQHIKDQNLVYFNKWL